MLQCQKQCMVNWPRWLITTLRNLYFKRLSIPCIYPIVLIPVLFKSYSTPSLVRHIYIFRHFLTGTVLRYVRVLYMWVYAKSESRFQKENISQHLYNIHVCNTCTMYHNYCTLTNDKSYEIYDIATICNTQYVWDIIHWNRVLPHNNEIQKDKWSQT